MMTPQELKNLFYHYTFFKSKETYWCSVKGISMMGNYYWNYYEVDFNKSFREWKEVSQSTTKTYGEPYEVNKDEILDIIVL